MTEIILLLVIAGFVILGLSRRGNFEPPVTQASDAKIHHSYRAAESLFVNRAEHAFFHTLSRALPEGYYVQSKVRLEDIVGVKREIKDTRLRWSLRGRVKSRHVDFLVIDETGRPCLVAELDGRVHTHRKTDNADALKDGLFQACGIPLVRVRTGEDFKRRAQDIAQSIDVRRPRSGRSGA